MGIPVKKSGNSITLFMLSVFALLQESSAVPSWSIAITLAMQVTKSVIMRNLMLSSVKVGIWKIVVSSIAQQA